MHDDRDPEIEYSPLCEEVTQDGLFSRTLEDEGIQSFLTNRARLN
jgi:hypothetical protein